MTEPTDKPEWMRPYEAAAHRVEGVRGVTVDNPALQVVRVTVSAGPFAPDPEVLERVRAALVSVTPIDVRVEVVAPPPGWPGDCA